VTGSLVVFTRDLRIHDNPALAAAAMAGQVVPLFVFDDVILHRHARNVTRLALLLDSLRDLAASLRSLGGDLVIRQGSWASTVLRAAEHYSAGEIHVADDVSGYAIDRLARLRAMAASSRVGVIAHPGVTVSGPAPLRPGGPYEIFTPFYRRWLTSQRRPLARVPDRITLPTDTEVGRVPTLAEFVYPAHTAVGPPGGETAGQARLTRWVGTSLAGYGGARDDLAADATSRLSPYLHLGCLSPLAVTTELAGLPGAEEYLRQLAWRDFFCQVLAHRPDAARNDYRDRGDQWHDDPDGLAAWQEGQTGFPVVDAAMRQLDTEGFMPNRARMVVASFLTKDLYIDWRAGAAHFATRLADADVACNQLNWQWVAGTGTDRQPFRIFNPTVQGKRFDPRGEYITRHVPELAGLPPDQIHDPDPAVRKQRHYPAPILDHQAAAAAWRARQPAIRDAGSPGAPGPRRTKPLT
jgi:deoxyribodipyrimidine photo-lyase